MWPVRLPEGEGRLREEEMWFLEDALGIRGRGGEGGREQGPGESETNCNSSFPGALV